MTSRSGPGSADSTPRAGLDAERLAKVAGDCLLALGPVLGLSHCRLLGQLRLAPSGLSGMAVTLEGNVASVVVGVLSNQEGRTAIARALFQMGAGEQPAARDEADAVGELANVIAGRIKLALSELSSRLSVPTALAADAAPLGEQVTLRISFGNVPAALVIGLR